MSKSTLPANVAVAAAIAAVDDAGAPRKRVLLLPMGAIRMRAGDPRGPFRIADQAHADRIVAASALAAGSADMPIDYDHQLVYAVQPGQGGRAEAAGWVSSLEADAAGVHANIDWTDEADAKLRARKYRYISPVFGFDAKGDVTHVTCGGLTNFPAITDLPAIAASATMETGLMSKIATALGLAADAGEDAILGAIAAMKTEEATEVAAAAAKLGLTAGATIGQIAAAAIAAKPDPAKFVPIAALEEVTATLGKINGERAGVAVAAAMTAGKVTPALKDWAVAYFVRDEPGFAAWLDKAPVVVAAGATVEGQVAAGAVLGNGLTADEANVCRLTGTKPEDFLKAKKG